MCNDNGRTRKVGTVENTNLLQLNWSFDFRHIVLEVLFKRRLVDRLSNPSRHDDDGRWLGCMYGAVCLIECLLLLSYNQHK